MLDMIAVHCFLSLSAQAGVTKGDFAFGQQISFPEGASVVELILPDSAYQLVRSPELADLAVFNGREELVSHFFPPRIPKRQSTAPAPLPLTGFPVPASGNGVSAFSRLRISTSPDGTIRELVHAGGGREKRGTAITGYLFDLTKAERMVSGFRLRLSGTGPYLLRTLVEGSQDLESWQIAGRGGVLAHFEVAGETLEKNELSLPTPGRFRYYRVSWETPVEGLTLASAEALFPPEQESVEEPPQWKDISASAKADPPGQSLVFRYDAGGFYPVSALRVRFSDPNSQARFSVEAANAEAGPWSGLGSAAFFSVNREGVEISRLEHPLEERVFRYWRLRLDSSPGGIGASFPALSVGWRPGRLRFLARGGGPFVLAYGAAELRNPPQQEQVFGEHAPAVAGTLKERVSLGGVDRLRSFPKPEPLLWRRLLLGALLLLGVCVLGGMAYQLMPTPPHRDS